MKALTPIGLSLLLLSCGSIEPLRGTEGGECRLALKQCDDGLSCIEGSCEQQPAAATAENLLVEFFLSSSALEANGKSTAAVQLKVIDVRTGEPYGLKQIRLWVDPPYSGQIRDGVLVLDEEGKGLTTFTACDKRFRDCYESARINVARLDEPLKAIAGTVVTIEGGRPYNTGPGDGGAGGGTGEPSDPGNPAGGPYRFPLDELPKIPDCGGDSYIKMELKGDTVDEVISFEIVEVRVALEGRLLVGLSESGSVPLEFEFVVPFEGGQTYESNWDGASDFGVRLRRFEHEVYGGCINQPSTMAAQVEIVSSDITTPAESSLSAGFAIGSAVKCLNTQEKIILNLTGCFKK